MGSHEKAEQVFLKDILYKLYLKLVQRRKLFRPAMQNKYKLLINEEHKFAGIGKLLEVQASLISGFAVPLKQENIDFFDEFIVPLHKVQTCQLF